MFGCEPSVEQRDQHVVRRTLDQRLGTQFNEVSLNHFKPPNATQLEIPIISEDSVLWGAKGRDDFGHVYFGVSTYSKNPDTAFPYQYFPHNNSLIKESNIISQLKKAGLYPRDHWKCSIFKKKKISSIKRSRLSHEESIPHSRPKRGTDITP